MEKRNFTQEEYQQADNRSLVELAQALGFTLKHAGNGRLRMQEMDSMEIDPQKNCFYRHSQNQGGGPIQFIKIVKGLNTVEAVHDINGNAFHATPPPVQREKASPPPLSRPFVLPERAPRHNHIFAYLNRERKIAPDILAELLHQKRLYETIFSHQGRNYYNCVFVGMNAHGEAVHASSRFARKTDGKAWRVLPGSDFRYPFSMAGSGNMLYVYESAIDAMSGATLDLMVGKDWRDAHRLALNGLSPKPLEQYLKEHPTIKKIVLCLDNDLPSVAKGEENHGQEAAKSMTRFFRNMGYDVERMVTQEKDVNQALLSFINQKQHATDEKQENTEWENTR